MEGNRISLEVRDGFAYVGFGYNCNHSMTVLDEESLAELRDHIAKIKEQQKDLKGAILFSHKESCFLAGADIKLIASLKTQGEGANGAEQGQFIFNDLEDLKVPTIACVHGVCLGGGLEMSLACNYIIASDDSKTALALPEVKLGLIPGFGGTYRLPKKVGLPNALDMILTGKMVKAKKAKRIELVDGVYAKERLLTKAIDHLTKKTDKNSFKENLSDLATDNFLARKIIFQKARENVLKKTKGFYQAPLKILDVMEAGSFKSRASYLTSESQAFGELCVSNTSKNLQHLFFLTEQAKKYSGPEGESRKLKKGAALGAGTMGGGIAWLMANNDMAPIMKDLSNEALELGLKQASSNFRGALKRKRITPDQFNRLQRTIAPQLDYNGFKSVDLLIEAVVENMDIKKKVFAEVEREVSASCILTSNTSSLSVQEMSEALEDSSRFAGLHFFNPVHMMPLVEIITHDKVSPDTVKSLYNWVLKAKKTPVIVKDGPGFLVNRILMPYLNEAGFLLTEGVSVKDLDEACLNFGMPMGPCRLLDEIGIDVASKVAKIIHDGLGDRAKASNMLDALIEKNLLGKKTSKGFYNYDDKGKVAGENSDTAALLPGKKIKMSEIDIQMRVFLPMINEASYILDEGIVTGPDAVDLGLIFGIGFPPFRGGLLRYADGEGLERILTAIKRFRDSVDEHRYSPSPFLENLVESKKNFYDL